MTRWVLGAEQLLFLLFVLPNLILFGVLTYWPMIYSGYLSSVHWDMLLPRKNGVGLDNYRYLFQNEEFHEVLVNTVYFTSGAVGASPVLGLATVLLLNQPLSGRDGARAVLFAPTLLSRDAISLVWFYMFDPRYGLIAVGFNWVRLGSPNWLREPAWAMPAVIIVYVWKNVSFTTVIYLAGLQAVPKDLYEAAKIDGAGALWRFRSVTLPLLSPITFFLLLTSILNTFQAFDIIQVMTDGGPAYATTTLVYYVYQQGFGQGANFGRAAAAAVVLFISMLVVTAVQMRFTEKKVHYDG